MVFIGLAGLLVAAVAVVMVATEDPTRGLALGALPVMFFISTWALTNRAGYADQAPDTSPHQRRSAEPAQQPKRDRSPAADGDPFAKKLPLLSPATSSKNRSKQARSPAPTPQPTTRPAAPKQPKQPSASPAGAKPTKKPTGEPATSEQSTPPPSSADTAKQTAELRKRGQKKRDGKPDSAA